MSTSKLLSQTSLLLLAAVVALYASHGECSTSASSAAGSGTQVITEEEATTCLRDLNSYLDKRGFGKKSELEPSVDWSTTGASIRESLGKLSKQLELSRRNPELVSEDVSVLASVGCNSEALLALAQNLRESSEPGACDQPSVDFLMVIANYDLSERRASSSASGGKSGVAPPREAVLNEFARSCVDSCWAAFVGSVSPGLERALGKMVTLVFSFIEGLSKSVQHTEAVRAQFGQMKEIKIYENKPAPEVDEWGTKGAAGRTSLDARRPGALREAVKGLKQLKVDSDKARTAFAMAVNEKYQVYSRRRTKDGLPEENIEQFYRQFFVSPCEQLVQRVRDIVGRGAIYQNHISQTLGQALADEKRANPRLEYELQMFRICKLANLYTRNILTKLATIRKRIDFALDSSDLYDEWY